MSEESSPLITRHSSLITASMPLTDKPSHLTPMLRQYHEIKKQYPGTLLFFRLGDFYELFFDDALIGSREMEITLTARHKERGAPVPMCGVPYHATQFQGESAWQRVQEQLEVFSPREIIFPNSLASLFKGANRTDRTDSADA